MVTNAGSLPYLGATFAVLMGRSDLGGSSFLDTSVWPAESRSSCNHKYNMGYGWPPRFCNGAHSLWAVRPNGAATRGVVLNVRSARSGFSEGL